MRRLVVGAIAVALFPVATAHAQSKEDLAHADALFNAAKALTDSGQFTDACAKFAESKRLVPGLGVTLYLADCYEHIGRNASAWTEFRSAEGLARERNDKRAEVARQRAQAIEPKLNRLTVIVAPNIPRSGLQVLRDGVPVAQEELGLPIPIDPGAHVVVVSLPGHKVRTFNARVDAAGQTATVNVDSVDDESPTAPLAPAPAPTPALAPAPALAPEPPPQPATTSPSSDPGATRRYIGLGGGALGVVGLGVGSAFGLLAMSKRDQSNKGLPNYCDQGTNFCSQTGLSLRKDAETLATGSTVGFVAGGVALAAGIVLYVTAPKGSAQAAQGGVTVSPAPMAGGGGATVRASFW
jgi:hypothetical protein